jgi:hypothetical protein
VLVGRRLVAAWVVIGVAAAASLTFPEHHVVVLAHLHQVVPLFFLWEWSRRITSRRGRRAFRAVQLLWVVAIPALVLTGLLDGLLTADPGMVRSVVGDGQSVLAASALPGTASTVVGLRLLTVFAFLQTMTYVVWVALMPRVAPDASAAFEARLPWATGPRLWAAGFVAAALFAVLFGLDFTQGRMAYAALSGYAAYLELSLLLVMLLGGASLSVSLPAEDEREGEGETASKPGGPPLSSAAALIAPDPEAVT